jgi:hypothetical protein
MRFNPNAFKRAAENTATAAPVITAATTTATVDTLPVQPDIGRTARCFINLYGRPDANRVTIPEGSMAVTLCLKFNDSAAQVDHFDYHAPLGCPDFLLLQVRKQAQTEHLARKALALCPELQILDWQWKSEKYAGGHGNYLASSYFPTPPALREHITARKTFGGGIPDALGWEIEFIAPWRGATLQLWPHKHYGNHSPDTDFSRGRDSGSDAVAVTAAWRLNDRLNGVEIHFTRRPDDATLAPLRADPAWRYSGHSKCWYARQSPQTNAFAKEFCEQFNGGQHIPPAQPFPVPVETAASIPPIAVRKDRRIIRFTGDADLPASIAELMRPKIPA